MRGRTAYRPEDQIQRAVIQHLRTRAAPGVFAFHVPNGGYRRPVEAAILKGLGVVAGTPDIFAIKGGHCYALELKAEDGRLSLNQVETMANLRAAGATCEVTYSLDEALRWLERHGLLVGVVA